MNHLFKILEPMGKSLEMTGKTPFFLDDPEKVWCVVGGEVHVYVVSRSGDVQTGRRDYLFSSGPGSILLGVDTGFFGKATGLLVSGVPGTSVVELSRSDFLEAARTETSEAASLVDGFLEGLGRGIIKDIVPLPRIRQEIVPGDAELQADRPAGSASSLWIELRTGRALFVGTEDMAPGGGFFALPSNCWILPLERCSLSSVSTEDLIVQGDFSSHFDRFSEVVFSSLAMNSRMKAADDVGELREMQRSRRTAMSSGMGRLFSHLSGGERASEVRENDPVSVACSAVAAFLRVDIPRSTGGRNGDVPDVLRRADLRTRKITLAGDWWISDGDPMIAFREDRPVALIPKGRGGYRMVDCDGELDVDRTVAESISPEGLHVYLPMPTRPLNAWDLLRFGISGRGRDIALAVVFGTALALLGLIPPEINGIVFSEVIPQAERGRMIQLFAILVGVALSSALLRFAQAVAFLRTETILDHRVSTGVWDRILRLPVDFFRKTTSGDLANRALGLYMLRSLASMAVRTFIVEGIFVLFYAAQSIWYDWRIALAGLGCLAIQGAVMLVVNLFQLRLQRPMIALQNRISALTFQLLTGIAKIRIAGAEELSFFRWAASFGEQRKLSSRARKLENGMNSAMALISGVTTIAVVYVLVRWSSDDGAYDTGRFMAFWTAFGALQASFLKVVSSVTTTLNVLPLVENLAPILRTEPETGGGKTDPGDITGSVELDRVTFRYRIDGPPVLKDLSFSVSPGEFVAIVGPSGAGKSTVIRMLLGFDRPESGGIFFDHKEIGELDLKKLRERIGVVLQGGGLLPGSIASNVRCSRDFSVDYVEEALAKAGMKDDISEMPMGIHTVLTEGANTISGGQKQRLLIARAIAGKPRVLIFDEATSALDNRTQELVSESLEAIDATRIVVAHRLSTVMGADRILVMDRGAVAEEGTYDELMKEDGLFADLVRRQMA